MNTTNLLIRSGLLFCASLLLSACTTTPAQHSVLLANEQLSQTHPGTTLSSAPAHIDDKTIDLKSAIQLLLSQSPQVRIEVAQLGVADAQRLQAELISNPHLSIGALKPEDGGRWQLDVGLSQPLLELFTRPLRRQLADDNLLSVQLRLQSRLQTLIAQTGDAYYSAIAARQHVQVQRQMLEATLARQQLANSLYRAGNMSENSYLYYDNELRRVQQQVKKREHNAHEKNLVLLNMMGMDSHKAITLPNQLPVLPTEKLMHADLLKQAQNDRLDIKITTQQLSQLENRRSLIRKENGWRDMSVGINAEREFDGATNVGPELEFALPIFNRNQGKLAAVDAQATKTQAQLTQALLDADTEIAQALNQMQSAREQLDLISASLQVAEKRVTLSNREVNFMLGSPFELLNIKRQQIQLAHDYTNELKNYWQARTQLELAMGRALPLSTPAIDHSKMSHDEMDHSEMDHSKMNHSEMNHAEINHDAMNHSTHQQTDDHSAHQHNEDDMPTESVDKTTSEHKEHNHD
jgi:cobalt-zinc-cadmium efflux system outer membrane protein